ncbi:uncharacterized protein BDZ99DRAFT_564628 [Mytilinidion resinicola]|uniref:5-nitroimidazole antibiotic resistance protein n=1 Tax=Mytilinidion resinicola TaxID=574789 RepID=A0A6A6Z918_9PEZI|nr:uncharacterized protein BDZ99DRAFT_564628 [Mytilinidion resinicola]KAF2816784.1 hypothetical protein BDZ99DRAFT_564628 [Mytilinidion resinicola]
MASPAYEKTPVNTVKRLGKERGNYDYKNVHSIVNSSPVVHVSFNPIAADDPFPAVLPMLGVTGSFTSQDADPATSEQDLYIHGYVGSRLMKQSSASGDDQGTPVTVAATLMDGLVLALTPNHHSCNYRSAVVFGYASLVTDEAEKLYALELITNNMIPNLWANCRVPPNKTEMTSTTILRVKISLASAKIRSGGPSEDRHDAKDEALRKRVWTGVVPSWTQWGEPIPAKATLVEEVPEHVESWRALANRDGRVGAYEAAVEKEK